MKKYRYNTAAFLVIILLATSKMFAAEVTKEYHKEFTAKPATTLDINSKYGNVTIVSWDSPKIVIEVKITVNRPSKENAEKDISNISVLFSEDGNTIKARTEFNSRHFSRGIINNNRNDNITVDYNIKMPVATALTLDNSYGNTFINELSGLVNLRIGYGNLTVDKLTRGDEKPWNNISLRYGNGTIEEAGWLTLNVQYAGNLNISKCAEVLLDGRYSKINFGEVNSIVGEGNYNEIMIDNIKNLTLDSRYSNVNIKTLTNNLTLDIGYGALMVHNITTGFESIKVETRYAPVKLGIADNANYELNSEVRYGRVDYDNNKFNINRRIQENNLLTIVGIMGQEAAPKAKVKIEAAYATVSLVK